MGNTTWTRTIAALTVALAVIAGPAAPAHAADPPEWRQPIHLLGGDGQQRPSIVTGGDGRQTVVWSVTDTSSSSVRAISRDADGAWSAPAEIATEVRWGGVELAAADDGSVYAAMLHDPSADVLVRRLAGDVWHELPPLAGDHPAALPAHIDIAVASDGDLLVLWTGFEGSTFPPFGHPYVARYDVGSGTWTEPVEVGSPSTSSLGMDVVEGPTGEVWVTYSELTAVGAIDQHLARRVDGATPGDAAPIGAPGEVPIDAVATADTVMLVTTHEADGMLAYRHTGSGWEAPFAVFPDADEQPTGSAAANDEELVVTAATGGPHEDSTIQVRSFDGAWSEPTVVATQSDGATGLRLHSPTVSLSPAGDATLAWYRDVVPGQEVEAWAARTSADDEWSPASQIPLGPRVLHISVATGHDGTAHVAVGWTHPIDGFHATVVADVDSTPPPTDPPPTDPPPTDPPPAPFDDVPEGTFFTDAVAWARHEGHTTGVGGSNRFEPHRPITRAEAVTLLHRIAGSPPGAPSSGFVDVDPSAFYAAAVDWARADGLTTGVGGSNEFHPHRDITRAELITLMWRQAGSSRGASAPPFDDVDPSAFYAAAVDWARADGLTTGVGGANEFHPHRAITRAEAFTLQFRAR